MHRTLQRTTAEPEPEVLADSGQDDDQAASDVDSDVDVASDVASAGSSEHEACIHVQFYTLSGRLLAEFDVVPDSTIGTFQAKLKLVIGPAETKKITRFGLQNAWREGLFQANPYTRIMAARAVKIAVAKSKGQPVVFQTLIWPYQMDVDAVYRPDCQMWLNGPEQWHDHLIGKKHRKNIGR